MPWAYHETFIDPWSGILSEARNTRRYSMIFRIVYACCSMQWDRRTNTQRWKSFNYVNWTVFTSHATSTCMISNCGPGCFFSFIFISIWPQTTDKTKHCPSPQILVLSHSDYYHTSFSFVVSSKNTGRLTTVWQPNKKTYFYKSKRSNHLIIRNEEMIWAYGEKTGTVWFVAQLA
jgi:hypothetical protein